MTKGERGILGRAEVAPTGTKIVLDVEHNSNNTSPNASMECHVNLTAVSAEDGGPLHSGLQVLEAWLPHWLVIVFDRAGSNDDVAAQLPHRIQVPVWIDRDSREIVGIDVDAAADELSAYRDAAVHVWKREHSVLAPVRNLIEAPGAALRGLKAFKKSWKGALPDLKGPAPGEGPKPGWSPGEVEQMRRQAEILALRYQKNPAERDGMRNSSLAALPLHAQQYTAGQLHVADMEALLMQAETATWITPAEAAEFRRQAGLESRSPEG